jgi:serine/threonine protein kinase
MQEFIAKGSTSDIIKICDGGQYYALKLLDSRKLLKCSISVDTAYYREVRALSAANHRNIVTLIHHEQLSPCEYSITMTYCGGGSLFPLIHDKANPALSVRQKAKIICDILQAVEHIHTLPDPLIHGDLKSLNLLLVAPVLHSDTIPWIKLCDFGSSRFLSEPPRNGIVTVGTIQWMAPEVIEGCNTSPSSDMYSVSMLIFEVLYRKVPFDDIPEKLLMPKILKGVRPVLSGIEQLKMTGIIESLWVTDASIRPTAKTVNGLLKDVLHCSNLGTC